MSSEELGARVSLALAGRYRVVREIAQGGMSTVFLAHPVAADRPVALKVMHPRLAAVLGAERFHREIGLVRSMHHPLIVPLQDSGEADGLLFYTMPYIEGETLFQRLRRNGRIELTEALRLTIDVASGLGYAHQRGFLHRDIKPENVLLADGHALVADFGLARAIGAEYTRLTRTGIILGSVGYMSPEQLREDDNLDQRVDIYSLGCILYEMLTGEPPYVGETLKMLVARILQKPVPSAAMLVPSIPAWVDRSIARAMAKNAQERFGTMADLVDQLGRKQGLATGS